MEKKAEIHRLLHLPPDASSEEIEQGYTALLDWLESDSIPEDLRPWASAQAALIQQVYEGLGIAEEPDVVEAVPVSPPPSGGDGADAGVRPRLSFPRPGGRSLLVSLAGVVLGLGVLGILWATGVVFSGGEDTAPALAWTTLDTGELPDTSQARIEQLKAAATANPGDAAALFDLGESYITNEDWEETIYWFGKLLEVEPANVHALIDIGTANMNLGREQEAQDAFNKALALEPENVQAHYNLAFLLAFRGDAPNLDEAVWHWREVIRLAPDSNLAGVSRVHLDQFQATATPPDTKE